MNVIVLNKTPFNIQKCLLSDCEFLKKNHNKYCFLNLNDRMILVKIGLSPIKCLDENTVFVDDSVFLPSLEPSNEHQLNKFTILGQPSTAKSLNIIVVFDDIFDVKKHRNDQKLEKIIGDVLQCFVISKNFLVSLNCLPSNQRFGIQSIIICDIEGLESFKIFLIDSKTRIKIDKCLSKAQLQQLQDKKEQFKVGGCSKIYKILKETILIAKAFDLPHIKTPNKLLLVGPSGCGKSTLVCNLSEDCKCILLKILPSDINSLSSKEIEKKLKNIFDKAKIYSELKESSLILIEDVDLMSTGKRASSRQFIKNLIELLESVEEVPGIMVIATTSSPDSIDLQLRKPKRFEDELEIMIPGEEERVEIIENILSNHKIQYDISLINHLAKRTPGFVGADLWLLIRETLMILNKFKIDELYLSKSDVVENAFKQGLTKVIPSALRGAVGLSTKKNTLFSNIGGLDSIKKVLNLSVKEQLENPHKFLRLGIPLTKGILLYGPPGCAKTSLVKALAKECDATFLVTSAADLYSPFVGDAEKKIVQLFTQARMGSPSIVFIDEIDAVVGSKSGDRERGVQERILSTLLIEMDGVGLSVSTQRDGFLNCLVEDDYKTNSSEKQINNGVIVIGATNRPQLLDDALKRPGRFDRLLYVPPPDENERFRILQKLTEKINLDSSVDLMNLAKRTNFYSGADLRNLCQESGLYALNSSNMLAESIHQSHFEYVLKEYKPSLNKKMIESYELFNKYNV